MDTRSQESKLRNEIQYLTRLIAAHKAIKSLQTPDEAPAAKVVENNVAKTMYRNKSVAAPSWTYPGSISSHFPLSLTASNSKKSSLVFLSSRPRLSSSSSSSSSSFPLSPGKQTPTRQGLNDSVQSMETSLIEGTSPLLPSVAKKDPERIVIISQRRGEKDNKTESVLKGVSPPQLPSETNREPQRTVIMSGLKAGNKRLIGERDKTERVYGGGKLKKMKLAGDLLSSPGSTQRRVVCDNNNKQFKNTKRQQLRKPDTSKLKWTRKDDAMLSDGVTKTTKATRSIPIPSILSRKRRRSSSSGGNGSFNKSPFIIKRYQLLRVTSATASNSFSQRRLHFITKQSSHSPIHSSRSKKQRLSSSALASPFTKRKSVHRVWAPNGGKKRRARPSGLEVKTRQGNKQWLSAELIKEKKKEKSKPQQQTKMQQVTCVTPRRAKRKVQVSIKGNSYLMSKNGKSMRRLSTSRKNAKGIPNSKIPHRPLSRSTTLKLKRANHVVQKNVNRVWSAKRNGPHILRSQYCLYYNRFGRCNRGDQCQYIHDPKRIAICSKFLRGKCENIDGSCPFSHNISKEKMPVCSFFLRGVCTRDNCPYLHVSVGPNAELCMDFIKGYCPLGEDCKKQHTLTCPDYSRTGTCPRGKRHCPLKHWRNPLKQYQTNPNTTTTTTLSTTPTSSTSSTTGGVPAVKEPYPLRRLRLRNQRAQSSSSSSSCTSPTIITPYQLDFLPLDTSKVPEFIAL
ncbi:PREDICTED: zinc finger CCCH domain-containing protein 3-like [Amphimedon queenslandica]|uniref:Zinc finger CCCH domain-containing protein 3 n=1 Tax=Amphimedon queenslandica TaxID=400682 RepID=A0A1X7VEH9_AMPQE|nr:PREDICTED: zinc finger CCCH domain-containing protein 3-like [Amphimedon queenslandica]|eukprot:XP_019849334.1 PREDICTED: zinc finger CCCH domain-containing protein 3-like [Amphimedon queenslandica]